jgi:hypothetical protein
MKGLLFGSGMVLLLSSACAGGRPVPDGSAAAPSSQAVARRDAAVDPLKTPGPVTVINSEQIEATGKPTVGQAMESLVPQQGGIVGPQGNNRGAAR